MYQITGDPVYIGRFRRGKAFRAGLMTGSLGAISVFCTALMITTPEPSGPSQTFFPRWLPRRCAAVAACGTVLGAGMSWISSKDLVGMYAVPQVQPEPEAPSSEPPVVQRSSARTL